MAITQVTRINPQSLIGVPVEADTVGQITALFMQLQAYGWATKNQTGGDIPNGWRLIISHTSGLADQVIYFGDWILVSDATFNGTTWGVSRSTQITCYGVSTELAGTAADFASTFRSNG